MPSIADLAQWMLFQTPNIKGDDGAFLIAVLFLVVGVGSLGLLMLTWMITGGTEMPIDPNYGKPKE